MSPVKKLSLDSEIEKDERQKNFYKTRDGESKTVQI
jgi:hypothetical protein